MPSTRMAFSPRESRSRPSVDDLALAVVLKSPLFGLNDDDLFNLAYDRVPRSLWSALKEKAGGDARFAEAHRRLSAWLSRADLLPPYEFFAELLGAEGQMMRERMLVRLGPEAAEEVKTSLPDARGVMELRRGSYYMNIVELIRRDLVRAGVPPAHVEIIKRCTCCEPEHFYSYRRDGAGTGRIGAVIALTE